MSGASFFGKPMDTLCRRIGGWPEDAVVYAVEVINDSQFMMSGEVATGTRRDGRPRITGRKDARLSAVITPKQYRAALEKAKRLSAIREEGK